MNKTNIVISLCARLLEAFDVTEHAEIHDIQNLKLLKSQSYALSNIYSFNYTHHHYYICDDYSLDNNPNLVKNVFEEINHLLKGSLLKNPKDALLYSVSLGNKEYYMWQMPLL